MQDREIVAYTKNRRGEVLVLWQSATEDGACTLDVWETQRWNRWEVGYYEGELVDTCALPKPQDMKVVPLRRSTDGTIYAFKCQECAAWWKVYQSRYHQSGCSALQKRTV